ncbi:MAG: hypothetical protein M3Z66_15990, partial [Chloroflexota bacterium]|nr:hypothetical protein [Chloroflexota bacterium]
VLSIAVATSRRGTPRADAYGILQRAALGSSSLYPYTGSSEITFRQIPWSLLPPDVAHYAGRHRVVAHWSVRDATHFRVDLQVLDPVLERGAITVVLNGPTLTTYDSRTETARVLRGTAWQRQRLSMTPRGLLEYFQTGFAPIGVQQPDSAQSLSAYLAQLQKFRSAAGVHFYARIVNRTRLLGHDVDVIQFAPLALLTSYVVCNAPATGECLRHRGRHQQAIGWARVWIEHDRPFILRYQEYGLRNVHNVLQAPIHVQYRVTSISYGKGPSSAALRYRPPIPVVEVHAQHVEGPFANTSQGQQVDTPPGWPSGQYPPTSVAPDFASLATTFYGRTGEYAGLILPHRVFMLPYVLGFDVLHGHPTRWVKVFTSWHGQAGTYMTGPYVLVQERKLAHGLPPPYQTGPPSTAGTCRVWTGRYADGQRWLSFRRGTISVVISTNSLSTHHLVRYASESVCT